MSLTLRMRRALAAFRANPKQVFVSVGSENAAVVVSSRGSGGSGGGPTGRGEKIHLRVEEPKPDSTSWHKHTDFHWSRVFEGKRLNYFVNSRGKVSVQFGEIMFYEAMAIRFLSNNGIDRP